MPKKNYSLENINQDDKETLTTILNKILRDTYLKGFNAGLAEKESSND